MEVSFYKLRRVVYKEDMNLKDKKEGYVGEFGERN